ncbi:hypothetical protein, partial [Burkholderia pseudomallei]
PPDIHKIRRQVTQSFSKAPRFSAMNQKKGREGGKRHRARGAHGQCHGNVQRRPKQRRQTGRVGRAGCGRHADGTRKDGGSAHCSPLSVAREGVVGSASNPHRCRHAAGPCRTRRATDATRRVTFRFGARAARGGTTRAMRGAIQADYIDRIRTSNARRTAAA